MINQKNLPDRKKVCPDCNGSGTFHYITHGHYDKDQMGYGKGASKEGQMFCPRCKGEGILDVSKIKDWSDIQ